MEVHGNLNMLGNALENAGLAVDDNWPANPQPGRFLFKNAALWFCTEIAGGLPVWIPITKSITMKRATITVAALEWTVPHPFNTNGVIVQIFDSTGKWVIPDEIITDTVNQVTVAFSTPMIGTAIIMIGETEGTAPPEIAFEQTFTNSDTWVVDHQLGRNPIISVIIGDNVVQPLSITTSVENMQTTITFSSPQTGTVRCV